MKQFIESVAADVRYAIRNFRRNPGFFVVACLSIAIGIAANTTVFSIANTVLLGDLPVRDPGRLFSLRNTVHNTTFSYGDYREFASLATVFEGVTATYPIVPASISNADAQPERIFGQLVSGNYFEVVGVTPALGRTFRRDEDEVPGRNPVVVLGHQLWKRRYSGDASIVGRSILLSGSPYTVIGVAPRGFSGTLRGLAPDFFAPIAMGQQLTHIVNPQMISDRRAQWLSLNARLKSGVSRSQATAALNVMNDRFDRQYRHSERPSRLLLIDAGGLPGVGSGPISRVLFGVLLLVSMVLLIACANVANLLLARASGRQREIAIRMAVGAKRVRLIRQLLTESVLLSLAGAALGLLAAMSIDRVLNTLELASPIPLAAHFGPDLRVLAYTISLSMSTAVMFGLLPALRATRVNPVEAMKSGNVQLGILRRFGLRNALVTGQVAAAFVLLAAGGLFLASFRNAAKSNLGMNTDHVLLMSFDPALNRYTPARSAQLRRQLRERVAALPGIEAVSYSDTVPLSLGGSSMEFRAAAAYHGQKRSVEGDVFAVSSGYFEALKTPLLRGGDFNRSDEAGPKLAVVNEAMAHSLYPGLDPVGLSLSDGADVYRIVGVAKNQASRVANEESRPAVYRSIEQASQDAGENFFGTAMLIRTSGDPALVIIPVRNEIEKLDRNLPVFNIETMNEHVSKALMLPRLAGVLFGVFGVSGLLLASIGLAGVIAYTLRLRTKEIGIRIAIGASHQSVLMLIVRQGLYMIAAGCTIGLLLALAVGRFASALLYRVQPTDLLTLTAVAFSLIVFALIATLVPAAKVMKIDPSDALRYD